MSPQPPPAVSSGSKEDCPTTTVTQTQYAATITKTIGVDPSNTTTPQLPPPTTIRTISLVPVPSGLGTHPKNITSSSLNSTITTTSTPPSSLLHASTPTPTPSSSAPAGDDPAHRAGRVAGGVIGSLAGLALLVFLLAWCCKRKSKVKLRLRCGGKRKDGDDKKKQEEEAAKKRAEEERGKALKALERGGGGEGKGLNFGLGGGRGGAMPSSPPPVPRKPVASALGAGRYYA